MGRAYSRFKNKMKLKLILLLWLLGMVFPTAAKATAVIDAYSTYIEGNFAYSSIYKGDTEWVYKCAWNNTSKNWDNCNAVGQYKIADMYPTDATGWGANPPPTSNLGSIFRYNVETYHMIHIYKNGRGWVLRCPSKLTGNSMRCEAMGTATIDEALAMVGTDTTWTTNPPDTNFDRVFGNYVRDSNYNRWLMFRGFKGASSWTAYCGYDNTQGTHKWWLGQPAWCTKSNSGGVHGDAADNMVKFLVPFPGTSEFEIQSNFSFFDSVIVKYESTYIKGERIWRYRHNAWGDFTATKIETFLLNDFLATVGNKTVWVDDPLEGVPVVCIENMKPDGSRVNCPLRRAGDANCDGSVDPSDFNEWRMEYYDLQADLDVNAKNSWPANFNCSQAKQKVGMGDFGIWRLTCTQRVGVAGATTNGACVL